MKSYVNIPSYVKNVKASTKYMVREQAERLMPSLTNTIVSNKDAFAELRKFDKTEGRIYTNYVKRRKNLIFGPLKDFIRNAKEDLKSGKFYNDERVMDSEYSYNGLESMIDNFGDNTDYSYDSSNDMDVKITSKFDKYLKSTTNGLLNNRALSNSLNEVNINNTEYIANVNTINNSKLLALTTKHHMESMKQLKNIENIGMSMMRFNEEVIAGAIERQDRFHDEMLNETRELKELIRQQTEFNINRFKGRNKSGIGMSIIDEIFDGNGSINLKRYFKEVKTNINDRTLLGMGGLLKEQLSGMKTSPISELFKLIFPMILPKNMKENIQNLDKSIISIFSNYLLKMDKLKRSGKSSLGRMIGEILGIDIRNARPNLSIYKNADMTLEIEQKKAKAITEVIPTYLAKITESITGVNQVYDYSRGVFVDRKKKREQLNKELNYMTSSEMYETSGSLIDMIYKAKENKSLNNNQIALIESDIHAFISFLSKSSDEYKPSMSYNQLKRKGLSLKGGEKSYRIIRQAYNKLPSSQKMHLRTEQLNAISKRPEIMYQFSQALQDSGLSSVYNEFDENIINYNNGNSYVRRKRHGYKIKDLSKKRKNNNTSLDDIDFDKINQALDMEVSKEKIQKSKREVNNEEEKESVYDNIKNKFSNNKTKDWLNKKTEKFKKSLELRGGLLNKLILGINDSLYTALYGEDKTGRGIIGKISDFTGDVLDSVRTTIFGEFDESGKLTKEGILPDKINKEIHKYLPKAKNGAIIGGLSGLIIKQPLLGAIAGASLNLLIETDKIKKFLWGDSENGTSGLLGGFKKKIHGKLNEKIIDPLKKIVRDKYDLVKEKTVSVKDKINENVKEIFELYDENDYTNKKGRRFHGKINKQNIENLKRNSGPNINKSLISNMERGIYSDQLDTIIALLSGGFGYFDNGGGKYPNSPNDRNTIILDNNQYKITSSDKYIKNNNIKYLKNNTINRYLLKSGMPKYLLGAGSSNKNIVDNVINKSLSGYESTYSIPINNNDAVINPKEIAKEAIVRYTINDPQFNQISKKIVSESKKIITESVKNKRNWKLFNHNDSKSVSNINNFDNLKKIILNKIPLKGIGKGQGALIGSILGTMFLSNPLLGAIAGATFTNNKSEERKNDELLNGKYKPVRTALKYGLMTTLLGMGPLPGMLMGSLFPQRKNANKKSDNQPPSNFERIFGQSSMKGKLIGGLAGLLLGGGIPGMIIGGSLGGHLIRKNKSDKWDIKYKQVKNPDTGEIEIVERSKKEQHEYAKQLKAHDKEAKRLKTAKGTIADWITGGGKIRAGAFGSLAGLAIGGLPGMMIGGLAGNILGTRGSKLNREHTGGILEKQGKWKSSVIGALIGNALMGPLFGPIVGGLAGSLLAKKTDQKFWKYDKDGNILNKESAKEKKRQFKLTYKYDLVKMFNEDRDLFTSLADFDNIDKKKLKKYKRDKEDAKKEKDRITKEENEIRDKNAKKLENKFKGFGNLENIQMFKQNKLTGSFKGAQIGNAFLGPAGALLGAVGGFLTSGKKDKSPDGSSKKPFYVKNVSSEQKSSNNPEGTNKTVISQTKRDIKNLVNTDDKQGDKKTENVYKDNIKKIMNSNMSPEEKQVAISQQTQVVTAMKTFSNGALTTTEEDKGGFFSNLLKMALPLLSKLAIPIATILGGLFLKGDGGHGTENEYGDSNHANLGDRIIHGGKLLASKGLGKIIGKIPGMGKIGSFLTFQTGNALSASSFYGNEAEAYADQGDYENAAEAKYGQYSNKAKAMWYGGSLVNRFLRTKAGTKLMTGFSDFATNRASKAISKGSGKLANMWGRMAYGATNSLNTANAMKGPIGRYKVIRGQFASAGDNIMKWARNKVASSADDVVSMTVSHSDDAAKITTGVSKFINKLFGNSKVSKLLSKYTGKLKNVASKLTNWVSTKLAKQLVKHSGSLLSKILGKVASIASVVLAWLPLATAVVAFINGWNNVNNELQLSDDYKPEWWERLTCALAYALDDFLCGAIDLFGLRDDLINFLIGIFGGQEKANQLAESKAKASAEYEKFLQENDLSREAFTMEQFQNATNKTIGGKIASFFGGGTNLEDYQKGGKKYDELKEKYGGYTPPEETSLTDTLSQGYSNQEFGSSTTNDLLLGIYNLLQSLVGGNQTSRTYVVQNNQKTYNISGGTSYDISGGRGSNSYNYIKFKPINSKISKIIKDNSKTINMSNGGRGSISIGGRGSDWLSIVKSVKQAIANTKCGYSQSKTVPITIGGRTISVRPDCSGFVTACVKFYGALPENQNLYTGNMMDTSSPLSSAGFSMRNWNGWDSLNAGDIIVNSSHAEIFSRNDGNNHYVYNCGSNSSCNNPGETISSRKSYTVVWSLNSSNNNNSVNVSNSSSLSSLVNKSSNSSNYNNLLNSKKLLQSRAKSKITTISENKTPEETVIDTTSNEDMQNILKTAYVSQDNFMNDPSIKKMDKEKINKTDVSNTFTNKIINGLKTSGSKILSGAKTLAGKAVTGIVKGASWLKDKISSGVTWVGGKLKSGWEWLTGGRGSEFDNNINYTIQDSDYYNQQDPRWADMSFGRYYNQRDTVGEGGCGPTTAATVLQKLTGQTITPAETSRYALNNGYKVDDGGTTPDYFNAIGSKYGVGFDQRKPSSADTINSLKQGKPVIFLGHDTTGTSPFGNDSHYVVGTGMDDKGNISILDPKNRNNNRLYNIKDIVSNAMNSIVPKIGGGRGSNNVINEIYADDTNVSKIALKKGIKLSGNGRGSKKNIRIKTGRGTINIIQESYNWNGSLAKRSSTNYIALHHAASPTTSTCQDIHQWHISNGWSGIGYHYVVYTDGSIHTGRPEDALGAHVSGMNDQSIGICAVGNYDTTSTMPDAQYKSIVDLCKYLKSKYPNAKIVGHKEIGSSDCPGKYFPLDKIKNEVGEGGGVNTSNSNSSQSSSNGQNSTSSSGNLLLNKLSGILDAISAPTNGTLDKVLNGIYGAYDNSTTSNSNSNISTNTSSSGKITSNDLGKILSVDEAYNRDPRSYSKITSQQLKDAIIKYNSGSYLQNYTDDIIRASEKTGVDPRFILAFAIQESGWNGSDISRDKNNYFGIGAKDSDPYNSAYTFSSPEEGFTEGIEWILKNYIEAGQNTFYKFNRGAEYNQRGETWRNYNSGGLDGMYPYAELYAQFINATGGAGRGGRGSGFISKKFNKLKYKNPFNKSTIKPNINFANHKNIINNKSITIPSSISKKYVDNISNINYRKTLSGSGRGGMTPIPSTASVIDALSLKSSNSINSTIDKILSDTSNNKSESNNSTITYDSTKIDENNKLTNAILSVLKGIASTLERMERNSSINNNSLNNIIYSGGNNGNLIENYKSSMMNDIVLGN